MMWQWKQSGRQRGRKAGWSMILGNMPFCELKCHETINKCMCVSEFGCHDDICM